MLKTNEIYNMDCMEGIKLLDDNSIDLVVIDPPYLLNLTKIYNVFRRNNCYNLHSKFTWSYINELHYKCNVNNRIFQ